MPHPHAPIGARAALSSVSAAEFSRRLVDNAAANGYAGLTAGVADAFLVALQAAAAAVGMATAPNSVALGCALYQRAAQSEDDANPIS